MSKRKMAALAFAAATAFSSLAGAGQQEDDREMARDAALCAATASAADIEGLPLGADIDPTRAFNILQATAIRTLGDSTANVMMILRSKTYDALHASGEEGRSLVRDLIEEHIEKCGSFFRGAEKFKDHPAARGPGGQPSRIPATGPEIRI